MINHYTILYNLIQVQNRIDIHTALVIGLKKDENTVSSTWNFCIKMVREAHMNQPLNRTIYVRLGVDSFLFTSF